MAPGTQRHLYRPNGGRGMSFLTVFCLTFSLWCVLVGAQSVYKDDNPAWIPIVYILFASVMAWMGLYMIGIPA